VGPQLLRIQIHHGFKAAFAGIRLFTLQGVDHLQRLGRDDVADRLTILVSVVLFVHIAQNLQLR
jgi:hypothetical protein